MSKSGFAIVSRAGRNLQSRSDSAFNRECVKLETLGYLGATLFWSCAAMLVYVYWGYGALLKLILLLRGEIRLRAPYGEADWPFVTILLTVHNEKDTIERRLQNLLEQ